MFQKNAVLVLGAGASAPFGYPLGAKLVENIVNGINAVPESLLDDPFQRFSPSQVDFLAHPYQALIAHAVMRKPNSIPSEYCGSLRPWKLLAEELHHTSSPTIDEFARANPSLSKVVKLLVATEIAPYGFDKNSFEENKLQISPRLTANARANWYGKLVASLRHVYPSADSFYGGSPLTVITFNYDRSLEQFLEREIPRAERYSKMSWTHAANVVHVHGSLEVIPKNNGRSVAKDFADGPFASAEQFRMLDDKRDGQDPAMMARHYLHQAEHIIVMGFDFHPQNVELIGLDNSNVVSRLRVLNYTGKNAFDAKARRAGVTNEQIFKDGRNYEIATAIDDGLFEFG